MAELGTWLNPEPVFQNSIDTVALAVPARMT
jgi:hypothetical protein